MSPLMLAILVPALLLGTTITLASTHWLVAWIGLELNTLAILPLMTQHPHPRAVEATIKYFLIQAAAAATLLFAATTNAWIMGQWEIQQMLHPVPTAIVTLALAMKIGLAPTHFWLPEVLQGLDLTTGLILSTWQKVAPFALLLQIPQHNHTLLIIIGVLSTLVGGWGGLNQTQLRKILAYSSIAHLGWMALILPFSPALSFLTLIIYITMSFSTFIVFKLNNATTINTLAISWAKSPALSAITPLVLLSLAGLPPLSGFMPKWLILTELTKQGLALIATVAALSALLSLYFYLRLSYAMTLTMSSNTNTGPSPWRLPTARMSLPVAMTIIATLALLPLTPLALALFTP
uniref:NADH dehydrogenase subunit 2 n=1 Tax=Astrapogon stellatus TaxID=588212 RepID=UPI0028D31C85|nr:NADH dehydrogenase subunit 2 [Astrapogon stellatus]WMY89513.1 NADH dehydrogenase subunit 2 [Astrapogon stellatus]